MWKVGRHPGRHLRQSVVFGLALLAAAEDRVVRRNHLRRHARAATRQVQHHFASRISCSAGRLLVSKDWFGLSLLQRLNHPTIITRFFVSGTCAVVGARASSGDRVRLFGSITVLVLVTLITLAIAISTLRARATST